MSAVSAASSGRAFRLVVDMILCDAHGVCAEVFPEGIVLDDWGYPILTRDPISGVHLKEARAAVRACPALALKLVPFDDAH